jgi:hypothetical protein
MSNSAIKLFVSPNDAFLDESGHVPIHRKIAQDWHMAFRLSLFGSKVMKQAFYAANASPRTPHHLPLKLA